MVPLTFFVESCLLESSCKILSVPLSINLTIRVSFAAICQYAKEPLFCCESQFRSYFVNMQKNPCFAVDLLDDPQEKSTKTRINHIRATTLYYQITFTYSLKQDVCSKDHR